MVLDDLHVADAATLDLLAHVARVSVRPWLMVVYRGAELDLAHPLARCLGEIERHRACEYILLTRLPRVQATVLLEDAAGRRLEPRLVEEIYGESAGNPVFLTALGRQLQRLRVGDLRALRAAPALLVVGRPRCGLTTTSGEVDEAPPIGHGWLDWTPFVPASGSG